MSSHHPMFLISITRLRLRSRRYVPAFIFYSLQSLWQAWQSEGNFHARVKLDAHLAFWTVTLWESEAHMRAFQSSGSHRRVMPKLAEWCDEATYVHWMQESKKRPGWDIIYHRLVSEGIISHVKNPSPNHEKRTFPRPIVCRL